MILKMKKKKKKKKKKKVEEGGEYLTCTTGDQVKLKSMKSIL